MSQSFIGDGVTSYSVAFTNPDISEMILRSG